MADFSLIPCDRVFAKISDELSSYENNGILDQGKFFSEVKWFANQMGLAVYELDEALVTLNDHKGELPCDFYLLDSAWLCHNNHHNTGECGNFEWKNFQDKVVIYTEKSCETVQQACGTPNWAGIVVNGCEKANVIDRVEVKEYILGNPFNEWNNEISFRHPRLMQLGNKITKGLCSKNSPHLDGNNQRFHHRGGEEDISIHKQGNTSYLYSSIKHPIVYVKYYSYPIHKETGLPLIADDPIMERALQDHLMLYFFKTLYLNGDDVNLENKIKMLKEDAERSMEEARYLSKLPSFARMVVNTRRARRRLRSYEVLQGGCHI